MSEFSVVGLQLETSNQNNLYAVQSEIESALRCFSGVDMVVVGELATYGSKPETAQATGGEAEQAYRELAAKHGIWLVPGSIFELRGDKVYNMAPVINPQGEVVDRYRKIFPFAPYEAATTPGDGFVVFEVPGVGWVGLCICYDIWFPEIARSLAWMGAELILCPTMTNTIDRELELCLARATAVTNQCYVMSLNVTGRLGVGQSITVDPNGVVLQQAGTEQEVLNLEVDFGLVRQVREEGVLGLGQTLKSFRDSTVEYPPYAGGARSEFLDAMGPLEVPKKGEDNNAF